MSYLLDASVWLASVDQDDRFHEAAAGLIRAADGELAALDLTIYEVASVAARRWADAERGRSLCLLVLTACEDRLTRVDQELSEQAVAIAVRENLTGYDAAYVAAARRQRDTLVSGDIKDLVGPGHAVAPDAVSHGGDRA